MIGGGDTTDPIPAQHCPHNAPRHHWLIRYCLPSGGPVELLYTGPDESDAAQHRPEQYERDETMPGRLAVAHERGRSWATAEAGRRKAEAARKAADREARRQARAAAIEAARQDREARKKARDRRATTGRPSCAI